ncbi:transposase [Bifidobacterium scardovii]|uniref:transposase n=1 Tax=Bifidobacterium scardovii TaxID=158787 RepID=UPI000AC97471|nr:transposase [Bifidobacterium scardovii]
MNRHSREREGAGQGQRAARRPHHRRHVPGDRRTDRHRARHAHGRAHHPPPDRPRHQNHQGPAPRPRRAGREAPGGPPSSHGPDVDARGGRQDREQHPPRHRRRRRRFKSAAHLAAYAGIAPVTSQSGTSVKGERPARGGNKRLKNALRQSAFVAGVKHPVSAACYKRKREQGKHHNAAVIRLARRCRDVIYSMLKNGPLHQG